MSFERLIQSPLSRVPHSAAACLFIAAAVAGRVRADELPIGVFSASGFGDWRKSGTAFEKGAAGADWWDRLEIENANDGEAVASSEIDGDGPMGTLTSPEFKIDRPYIAFRIAGGDYERHACVNLLVDGRIVRSATGWRSDRLTPVSWDVREFAGRDAMVRIVDEADGDWGHINVSHVVQTDQPERLPLITEELYRETLRPQFHFTARQWTMDRPNPGQRQEGWINDLNGLIYYDGEYHLFAQRWAKCWLHAVSRDLIHWTELDPAFWEESLGSGVQSGTCVVDYNNTSGLSPDKSNPPMVAFWSRFDNRSQCLSYSLDHGRTWKLYEKNPLMDFPERDPKVFWYEPGGHWVMMLYGDGKYHILTSPDLLNWKDEKHPIPDSFECPDFFELPVDGDVSNKKWVLIQGNGKYSVGTFDGREFKEETERFPCDAGPNFYATQSWHNADTGDGRRIQVAWMRGSDFPDMPFSQQISFPCELKLRSTAAGPRLFRQPIQQAELLHRGQDSWENRELAAGQTLRVEPSGQLYHLKAEMSIPEGAKLIFNLRGVPVVMTSRTLESGHKPAAVADTVQSVEILLDRGSVEVFVNHGEISCTRFVLPKENGLSVRAEGGTVELKSLTVFPLNSAWPAEPVK